MLNTKSHKKNNIIFLRLTGRIDGITSPNFEKLITQTILDGERHIVLNFKDVNYMSSIGLRVILKAQKKLKTVGGELILTDLNENLMSLLQISGFQKIFRIVKNESNLSQDSSANILNTPEEIALSSEPGTLMTIGNPEKLFSAAYSQNDVKMINSNEIEYGLGLAALGSNFEEYSSYFGDSVTINHSLFVFPATTHSAVDFMNIKSGKVDYPFLYGLGFTGKFNKIKRLNRSEDDLAFSDFLDKTKAMSDSNVIGVVFIAENRSLWSMNLKKLPLKENNSHIKNIFAKNEFHKWVNFPLEGIKENYLVLGIGIIIKDKTKINPELQKFLPKNKDFHFHCALLKNKILNKNPESFPKQIEELSQNSEPIKIQHLLTKSKFGTMITGIINIDSKKIKHFN